jgi:hypothetical protein
MMQPYENAVDNMQIIVSIGMLGCPWSSLLVSEGIEADDDDAEEGSSEGDCFDDIIGS